MDRNDVNEPSVVLEVESAFDAYERDLVANDVERLIEWFWDDERAVRYGIDESHVGFSAVAEYRRSQAMATLPRSLRNTVTTTFGNDMATVNTEFVPDGSDAVGRQSQTWLRTNEGWRIVSAHVSWLSGTRP